MRTELLLDDGYFNAWIDMKLSWLNNKKYNKINKKSKVQACVHKNVQSTATPNVHFSKSRPIIELKILICVPLTVS